MSEQRPNGKDASEKWTPLTLEHLETEEFSAKNLRDEAFRALYKMVKDPGPVVFEPVYSASIRPKFKIDPVLREKELEQKPFLDEFPGDSPLSGLTSSSSSHPPPAEEHQEKGSLAADIAQKEASIPQPLDAQLVADAIAKGEKDGYLAGFDKGETEGYAKGKTEGYEAGLKKGQEEGFQAGLIRAGEQVSFLEQLLTEMDSIRSYMVQRFEKEIMQMICRISEKVVYTEARVNHEVVKGAILQVFAEMVDFEEVTINVNPEDYDFVEMVKKDFFKQYKDLKQVSVLSNSSIDRGGCTMETHTGQVETSVESRLEAVQNSILNLSNAQD